MCVLALKAHWAFSIESSRTFGVLNPLHLSKRRIISPRLERHTTPNSPNVRNFPHVWSVAQPQTLQMRDDSLTFGALRFKRKASQLYLCLIGLLIVRLCFLRKIKKAQPREPALPSSLLTKADLACVESTLCFQL